jgi:trans-aconitate methyltransferase
MCHALFDLACGHGSSTWRLPRWYPALCAGFDVAYGARLLRAGKEA